MVKKYHFVRALLLIYVIYFIIIVENMHHGGLYEVKSNEVILSYKISITRVRMRDAAVILRYNRRHHWF